MFVVKAEDLAPSSQTPVEAICDMRGETYAVKYTSYYNNIQSGKPNHCRKCRALYRYNETKHERAKNYISELQKVCDIKNYKLLTTVDDFINVRMHIQFECPKHGVQTLKHLL